MKKLPIGIQNIREIVTENYCYIDKTAFIYRLISEGKAYFFSRPRRFGKSLLISTLEAIFQGDKALFEQLAIARTDWQWAVHPVIRIDFSEVISHSVEQLEHNLAARLRKIAKHYQVTLPDNESVEQLLIQLISQLATINRVVILIDEYDKPIIDHLHQVELAKALRNRLKDFYTVIKARDEQLKFIFLTGISKFSKMSVFSGMNNLNDISMHSDYANLLGCTEQEIDDNFAPWVTKLAEQQQLSIAHTRDKIREWYNGFRFSDNTQTVYTPYSLLLLFHHLKFNNYWFSTTTPTFLVNLIRDETYDIQKIEAKDIDATAFDSYDVEQLRVLPLLVQTGYLTIANYHSEENTYDLTYPNLEVTQAFTQHLSELLTGITPAITASHLQQSIRALKVNKLDDFFKHLQVFFANIPYQIQLDHEYYYQTIFYVLFKLIGLKIQAEMHTNVGRIDAVIETASHVYIIEFKFDGTAEQALQQINTKPYYQKYLAHHKMIVLVGVNFSKQQRNMDDYKTEIIDTENN